MVKKCAMPGIDQRSNRVWPNTSLIWLPIRSPRWFLRPRSSAVGWPELISLVSHSTRLTASTPTIAVMARPMTNLMSVWVSTYIPSLVWPPTGNRTVATRG